MPKQVAWQRGDRPHRQDREAIADGAAGPRLCYLAESFYPNIGGIETQGRLLAESLAARSLDLLVITNRVPASSECEETLFGARVVRVSPAADTPGLQRWPMMLTALVELLRRRRDYDIIFVDGFRTLGIPAVIAARLLGKKTVLKPANGGEMSGAFFDGRLRKYGLSHSHPLVGPVLRSRNAVLKKADLFLPNTTDVRDEILAAGVSPSKVVLLPNVYDPARFRPAAAEEKRAVRRRLGVDGRPVAVFVGRLVSWKGPQLLVRIWREFSAEGNPPLLLLVGPDGNDMHNCAPVIRRYVREHGLEPHVRLTGGVDDVETYLRAADVFVFPSQGEETATTAILEAMACGLPIVTTASPGVSDLVTDEVGRLVEREDLTGLKSTIADLLHDPPLRARLGHAAVERADQLYSASMVHAEYVRLFRELLR